MSQSSYVIKHELQNIQHKRRMSFIVVRKGEVRFIETHLEEMNSSQFKVGETFFIQPGWNYKITNIGENKVEIEAITFKVGK